MSEAVLKTLQKTISELINCDENEVTPTARLVEDLGFESIDFLELSMTLSQEYKLDIDEKTLFLSEFRPMMSSANSGRLLDILTAAYPHLPREELRSLVEEAPRGNVLKVDHLVRYLDFKTGNTSQESIAAHTFETDQP